MAEHAWTSAFAERARTRDKQFSEAQGAARPPGVCLPRAVSKVLRPPALSLLAACKTGGSKHGCTPKQGPTNCENMQPALGAWVAAVEAGWFEAWVYTQARNQPTVRDSASSWDWLTTGVPNRWPCRDAAGSSKMAQGAQACNRNMLAHSLCVPTTVWSSVKQQSKGTSVTMNVLESGAGRKGTVQGKSLHQRLLVNAPAAERPMGPSAKDKVPVRAASPQHA